MSLRDSISSICIFTVVLSYSKYELQILEIDCHVIVTMHTCCVMLELEGQPIKQMPASDKLNMLFSLA